MKKSNLYEILKSMKAGMVFAKHKDLAFLCGVSVSTLKKDIILLVADGKIEVQRAGIGCLYVVSDEVEVYDDNFDLHLCKVLEKV